MFAGACWLLLRRAGYLRSCVRAALFRLPPSRVVVVGGAPPRRRRPPAPCGGSGGGQGGKHGAQVVL